MSNNSTSVEGFQDNNQIVSTQGFISFGSISSKQHNEQTRGSRTLNEALKYAQNGWSVFPVFAALSDGDCSCGHSDCQNIGKHPKTANGFKDATNNIESIPPSFVSPNTSIGIVTGQASGICILDVDARNGGVDSIKAFEAEYDKLPDTPIVLTGSGNGSVHYYFKCPDGGVPSRTNLLEGVDFKSDGGYVIAPPSLHKSGEEYVWDAGCHYEDCQLADLPQILIDLICKKSASNDTLTKQTKSDASIAVVQEGQRNDVLFRLASSIRNKGCCEESIKALLAVENQKKCSPPLTESEIAQIASSVMRYAPKQDVWESLNTTWLPTIPLPSTEIVAPVMPIDVLPEAFQAWIADIAERMQIPLEMVAIPVICIVSLMIGCRLCIAPKKFDDWKVIPNLWAAVIARPGYMKSPAMKEAMKFVSALEAAAKKKYVEELNTYETKKTLDENFKDPPPKLRRVITNDPSVAKLGEILSQGSMGVLQYRDELFGFLKNLEKKGSEGDKQFYLEGFNGDAPFVIDRIERGTIDIDKLCISILGGIQPERFEEYFANLLEKRSGGDGFLARFQLIIYPQRIGDWKYVDRYPDQIAKNRAKQIFGKIYEMDFMEIGLPLCADDNIPICKFTDTAQLLFIEWYEKHQRYIRSGEITSSMIEEHVVKNAKLVPALALIFSVIDFCDPQTQKEKLEVNKDALQMAIDWCEYLHKHMYKVYAAAKISPHILAAHEIIKRIQEKGIYDGMTTRELKRNAWSKLTNSAITDQALTLLQEHNWLKVEKIEPSKAGGAPSEVIHLHPSLIEEKLEN